MSRRKLIEVALPLEAINREAAREKSIRHGHPSTLHLWWARRPLAAARAMLFAQLVDDPDSTAEADAITDPDERAAWVAAERARLFRLIEALVKWDNSNNENVLNAARAEIRRSTGGNPPPILDPFAGGGAIPLEAQRLGLEAHASDLNPVAVLINKGLIEIPPKFAGRPPVYPKAADQRLDWPRATGLAEDVRRYGAWMRDEAERRIGRHYPKAALSNGCEATVIAWIWARTVTCPNPACGIRMPLARSWWLGTKKGKEAYVVPEVVGGEVRFTIGHDAKRRPSAEADGTVRRSGATCIGCGATASIDYVRAEGVAGRLGAQLMALVTEAQRNRTYLSPDRLQEDAADLPKPSNLPKGEVANNPRWFSTPAFGMTTFSDLFTNRQLTALTTFSDLVGEARKLVLVDSLAAGQTEGVGLEDGGAAAAAYADAVATYLAFGVDKLSLTNVTLATWQTNPERLTQAYSRQAIPMTWDFAEANPLSDAGGGYALTSIAMAKVLEKLVAGCAAVVAQSNAIDSVAQEGLLLATDPPYYDNIGYSDLSDYFYVWLRRALSGIFPKYFATVLVPKAEELVANPYRHNGKTGAQEFFEAGFQQVFSKARGSALAEFPITVYYAFKQSESDSDGFASTGWATLLEGMIRSVWVITSTWPVRTELVTSLKSTVGALASSIVLALRPRPSDAPVTDRRSFTSALRERLPSELRALQQGSVAPVDLPQAAIGPGMAIFSRYSKVVEGDGSEMTVHSALKVINQVLGEVLSEQEGDLDSPTRWCLKWFESHGFDQGPYGDAETLASAYNTAVSTLARAGSVSSGGGKVQLVAPEKLHANYDPRKDDHITLWEVVLHLARALDEQGLDAAGLLMSRAADRVDLDAAKELAYLIFSIANDKRWSGPAQLFNQLAASWIDVADAASRTREDRAEQLTLS